MDISVTAKEDYAKTVLAANIATKALYTLYITNKAECFSFNSGCAGWAAKR